MEKLRMNDVRLRGSGFTLFPAAKEHNVDVMCADSILFAMVCHLGYTFENSDEAYEKDEKIERDNPVFSKYLNKSDFVFPKEFVESELLEIIDDEHAEITPLMFKVLKRAAEIQKKLESEHFFCSPCISRY